MSQRSQWTQALGNEGETKPTNRKPRRKATGLQAVAKARAPKETAEQRFQRYLADVEALANVDAGVPDVQCIPVTPVPKPRMSQRDVWEKRDAVVRYRAFCDEVRLRGAKLPQSYAVTFVLPMPDSWPDWLKLRMDGMPHLLKPDTSNLTKALEDALVPNDEKLHNIAARKFWGRVGCITINKTQPQFRLGAD